MTDGGGRRPWRTSAGGGWVEEAVTDSGSRGGWTRPDAAVAGVSRRATAVADGGSGGGWRRPATTRTSAGDGVGGGGRDGQRLPRWMDAVARGRGGGAAAGDSSGGQVADGGGDAGMEPAAVIEAGSTDIL